MNKDYTKLELDKILKLLSEQAYSESCRRRIAQTEPLDDVDKVREMLTKTADAFRLSAKFGTPRFSNIADPGEPLKRATQGGSLSLRELLDVAAVLREIGALVSWNRQCMESEHSLTYLFAQLIPNKDLLERIDAAVISDDEVADTASPELFRIRRSLDKQSLLIRERLDKLIRTSDTKKYLQESLVTQRDGRFVIPVKTEHKNEIPGLVHDTSGSGATLFVEPMGVVEANNQIRVLKSQEKDEIERVIAELSALCGGFAEELLDGFTACIKLEVCFAKANLGAKMRGTIPEIVAQPLIELRKARHPLIEPEKVVPVSMILGEEYTSLVVTGPNTGGKTVALKTAGLFVLMARCGLMLPAADGTRMGVFGKIYADIGDEQSIEQSLSTFSSHMNNIVRILDEVDKINAEGVNAPMVLLDELGSGTDPGEGGALAVAILDYLKERGALVIGTTHYQEVKMYALETAGVENASCEFDVATLRPTYRLITGAPGKSNALAIAKRLGLRDDVIERAGSLVSSENKRFDSVIAALEDSRREVDELKDKIAHNERESRELTAKLEEERAAFATKREKEMANARQRAVAIVESVRASADAVLDELEEAKRSQGKADLKAMRSRMNATLNKLHDSANPVESSSAAANGGYKPPRPYKKLDTVRLVDIDKTGSLISLPDSSGNCVVQIGIIKTKTNVHNLRLSEQSRVTLNGESVKKTSAGAVKRSGAAYSGSGRASGMELDIRGMTADEGVSALALFIDSSIMNHIPSATIIHGKGTGVLRRVVHDELSRSRQVADYRLGKFGEGEDGVTIVQFKE
ncbi:MAG: endonuclease MutS2 [Oscillospiraceae bacterium]|nr:endonuclease MutS2 [Oscillospiraceae bacterium]